MVRSLTLTDVKKEPSTFYVIGWYNADGSPMTFRRNGKTQYWKTRPEDFRIPIKRGLYETDQITPSNMEMFSVVSPASVPKKEVVRGRHIKR